MSNLLLILAVITIILFGLFLALIWDFITEDPEESDDEGWFE